MTCPVCKGVGFAWGGHVHRPQLRRCVCSGGPAELWAPRLPDGEPQPDTILITHSEARRRREAALRNGR